MHLSTSTLPILAAFIASLYLAFSAGNRMFPTIATIATGVELLLAFGIMSLAVAKFRIDVILPVLVAVSGIACWGKASSKGGVTAATTIALIGSMQALLALHLFR